MHVHMMLLLCQLVLFMYTAYKTLHSSHKTIDVLPILHDHQNSATVELHQFSLVVKNPVKNLIELCLNLSTNEAILPILVTLMLHCNGEQEKSNFQVSFKSLLINLIVHSFLHAQFYRVLSLTGYFLHLLEADLQGVELELMTFYYQVSLT